MTQPDKLPDDKSEDASVSQTLQNEAQTVECAESSVAGETLPREVLPGVIESAQDLKAKTEIEEQVDTETPVSRVPHQQLEYSLSLAKAAVKAAAENRGQNILVLDLSEHTSLFDYFLIVSGSSRRQLGAMCSEIERTLKTDFSERKLSVSGFDESRWIVLDYGSIVIHLFDEETREFYDLESLWGDGKPVDISAIVAQASAQMARFSD